MNDIVYFVKESKENEELRYSLRSLKNFPHNKVYFYGGCPKYLRPDHHIHVKQDQVNKWQNVSKMLRMACKNPHISADFWLFNDDFFIMEKVTKPCNYYCGDIYKRIVTLEDKFSGITPYSYELRQMAKELECMGCTTKNYALHVPILINKQKMIEVLNMTDCPMFRTIYANYAKLGGIEMNDVKITSVDKIYKGGAYLSTEDKAFNNGLVGQQIKDHFPDRCKYERS